MYTSRRYMRGRMHAHVFSLCTHLRVYKPYTIHPGTRCGFRSASQVKPQQGAPTSICHQGLQCQWCLTGASTLNSITSLPLLNFAFHYIAVAHISLFFYSKARRCGCRCTQLAVHRISLTSACSTVVFVHRISLKQGLRRHI
jgi:hypothetical protein